jgi:heptaprenyl diphosphate synthase
MKTKKLTLLALFTAIALVISLIETALPVLVPIPGIKLGLSNIITLIMLLSFKPSETFFVLISRILLTSIFSGQMTSFLYSLAGGILCFLTMLIINRILNNHFIFLTSMLGAVAHNIGQLLTAFFLVRTAGVLAYLPILLISGIITGLFTGLCAHFSSKYLTFLGKQ